jgi:hypothetical protein
MSGNARLPTFEVKIQNISGVYSFVAGSFLNFASSAD